MKTTPGLWSVERFRRSHITDVVLVLLLMTIVAFASFRGSTLLDSSIIDWKTGSTWFEADTPRIYRNMVDRHSDNRRSSQLHPLFSITANSLVNVLEMATGAGPLMAVRICVALICAAIIAALYGVLRLALHDRLAAVVFCVLAMTTSTSMFWGILPETYLPGCLSILFALLISALDERRRASDALLMLVSAATLSFTITNWMVGLFLAATHRRWKRGVMITFGALIAVAIVWLVQSRHAGDTKP
ncbi:MAG: hypothetical protein NTZ50_14720 [Chloroflexi bacterium]|nr:hypothetical protein [Chloroflexota bacterium]